MLRLSPSSFPPKLHFLNSRLRSGTSVSTAKWILTVSTRTPTLFSLTCWVLALSRSPSSPSMFRFVKKPSTNLCQGFFFPCLACQGGVSWWTTWHARPRIYGGGASSFTLWMASSWTSNLSNPCRKSVLQQTRRTQISQESKKENKNKRRPQLSQIKTPVGDVGSFGKWIFWCLTCDLSRHHVELLVQKCLSYHTSHALNMTTSAERSFNRRQHCGSTEMWLLKDLSRSHSTARYPLFRSCGLSASRVFNVIFFTEGTFNLRPHCDSIVGSIEIDLILLVLSGIVSQQFWVQDGAPQSNLRYSFHNLSSNPLLSIQSSCKN